MAVGLQLSRCRLLHPPLGLDGMNTGKDLSLCRGRNLIGLVLPRATAAVQRCHVCSRILPVVQQVNSSQ